jgi:hypothetical protein
MMMKRGKNKAREKMFIDWFLNVIYTRIGKMH